MSKIHRTSYSIGTKSDFLLITNGMQPIRNVPGVNEGQLRWFVHPETCSIVRIIEVRHRAPFEDFYTWSETVYDPKADTGFSTSGHKLVKVEGKTYSLHRIVALTFISNPDPETKTIVYHKNGDKLDCRASNLIWVSKKELAAYKKKAVLKPRIRLILKPKKAEEGNVPNVKQN